MKKLLLQFTLLFAVATVDAQIWVPQATGFSQVSSGVRDVAVVDTNTVWIIPYDGSGTAVARQDLAFTTDGGSSWNVRTVPVQNFWDWAHLAATDDSNAWAIFFHDVLLQTGQIWHTEDAGSTWTQQGVGYAYINTQRSFPNNIYFWNDSVGVIIGDQVNGTYEIYTTDDGGTTWDSVPSANIPPPADADENGWTGHFDVMGDTIWWDSNQGRVFRSVDRGHNWTVSATGLPVVTGDAIDVCFYSSMNGIARFYEETASTHTNTVVATTDGGDTWTPVTPIGDLFGADLQYVPGTASMLVSTGISNTSNYIGSSYSLDGGINWTTIETGTQRGELGIADSLTMWCGGFTTSPSSDGIYKFITIDSIPCNDPNISPGNTTASDTALCFNDTLTVTTTGVLGPVQGTISGISWIISTDDITGSTDITTETSVVASYGITFPAPETHFRTFINDGTLINGVPPLAYGMYYWTPVVFGNAVVGTPPGQFFLELTPDISCTFVGNSVPVNIIDPAVCDLVGVNEISKNSNSISASLKDLNTVDVLIKSQTSAKTNLEIVDLTGRTVISKSIFVFQGNHHETVSVENLSAGTYIIRAIINGQIVTKKFVKM